MTEENTTPIKTLYYSIAYNTQAEAKAILDVVCGYEYDKDGILIGRKNYFADLEPWPYAPQTGINPETFEPTFGPIKWYFNIYNSNGEELTGDWIYTGEVTTPYRVAA